MTNATRGATLTCDVLVIGSGAGGLSTAITARKHGLDVVVIEKEPFFGGTTAFSGGVLWIPGNRHAKSNGVSDTREAALTYMRSETGACFDAAAVDAFLDTGPEMLDFFERETTVKFVPTLYPDYHPNVGGGVDIGRSIVAAPFDARALGQDISRLRPPLKTITFIGMMFNSSNADLKHFFNATRSLTSALYVAKRLASHLKDLALYRRGVQITSGNALAARLAKSTLDLGIPIHTNTAARELNVTNGSVTGALVAGPQGEMRIVARRGVVLACGGFSHDVARIARAYPHLRRGGEHLSPVPRGNTGDGVGMAERLGARVAIRFPQPAAWMPVSRVPMSDGSVGVFPHLVDRYKPGVIGVTRAGKRFTNEANSYHDVGAAMIEACANERETAMWLICDHATIRKYGLGYAKPAPVPLGSLLRNGYLSKGRTLAELARNAGLDGTALEATVKRYNADAVRGEDREFGRGTTAGLAIGGLASAWLIPHLGWPSVLVAGGAGPLVLSVMLILFLPESAQFLAVRKRADQRIARILQRIAPHDRFDGCRFFAVDVRRNTGDARSQWALAIILSARYRFGTLMLWLAYFMGLLIYYLLTNWLPTLFKDTGFSGEKAALMTSLFPLGGILGNLCVGWVMDRFAGHRVIAFTYVLVGALVLLVGRGVDHQVWLGTLIFLTGTVATSAVTSMSALAASFYPTRARATGVAWMLGIGRVGGVAGALIGAALMGLGWHFGAVFSLLAVPAVIAAGGVVLMMRREPLDHASVDENVGAIAIE
ncbi:succinate dehydrogenase/fumarate reductase flavoprotein subunit/uncharacterized membrane protein [Paraburkholderia sp. Cpub6]|nr:succinate dehydrogenase/fumarate reductase flavoprotein subunit/uncharacterized membrane protein [Paraburkholderia sp. Cpub6]